MNVDFAKKLKANRKALGFTQESLAAATGIVRSQIAAYEVGKYQPNLANLQRFAEVLGVSLDDLAGLPKRQPIPQARFDDDGGWEPPVLPRYA